jgi:tetratricopeptide (TPR) repeat protein
MRKPPSRAFVEGGCHRPENGPPPEKFQEKLGNSVQGIGAVKPLLALILLLSLFLRFYKLGSRPLYGDEISNTVELSQKPLSFVLATNLGSLLYPLLLHDLLPLGDTEIMARLPAAVFGFLSVWGLFVVGRRILGEKEALIAAFLAAVSTTFIFFSQQARAYTAFLFFSLVSLYFFWRALHEAKLSLWVFYVLFQVLGTYAIFFLLVTLPIHGLFILLLALEKKISKRTFLYFLMSVLFIVSLTFLLYGPTRNTTVVGHVDFFGRLRAGLSGLLGAGRNINLFSLIGETIQRQLDYSTWPLFFFVKISLFFLGCGFCLKSKTREGFLFLFTMLLPFVFFSLSNPPSLYWSAQDNKFIFILPVFYLLMARGLIGVSAAGGRLLRRIKKAGPAKAFPAAFSVFLGLAVVFGEGVCLHNYGFHFWSFRSIVRSRVIDTQLRQRVQGFDLMIYDDLLNKAGTVYVKPVADSKKPKKLMICEADGESAAMYQSQGPGLWIVFRRTLFEDENLSRILAVPGSIEIRCPPSATLLYIPGGTGSLGERMALALKYLANIPGRREKQIEYHLLLAKLELFAERIPEALREIESAERIRSQPATAAQDRAPKNRAFPWTETLLFPIRMTGHDLVRDLLCQQIVDLLINQTESSLNQRIRESAPELLAAAKRLDPGNCESSPRFHQLSAECDLQRGARAEALEEYKRALLLCRNDDDVVRFLAKMREGLSLPSGLVLWQKKNIIELRWWSERKNLFSGFLASSRPLKKAEGFHLDAHDRYRLGRQALTFRGSAEKGRFKGLTIRAIKGARLRVRFRINGQKDVGEKIVLFLDEAGPAGLSSPSD